MSYIYAHILPVESGDFSFEVFHHLAICQHEELFECFKLSLGHAVLLVRLDELNAESAENLLEESYTMGAQIKLQGSL